MLKPLFNKFEIWVKMKVKFKSEISLVPEKIQIADKKD